MGSLAVDARRPVLRPGPHFRHRRPRSGRRRPRRLDAHAHRRARRGAACRSRARADHLPRVPAAGRAAVRPLDDAGGSVSSCWATIPASLRRDGRGDSEVPTPPVAGNLFISTPAVAGDIFGWGVIYALHARACIERGRVWQAEHYVGAVRDHALSLACLREGLTAVQARGYDDLSAETLARFEDAHVGALEPGALRAALAASVRRAHARGLGGPTTARPRRRGASLSFADEPRRTAAVSISRSSSNARSRCCPAVPLRRRTSKSRMFSWSLPSLATQKRRTARTSRTASWPPGRSTSSTRSGISPTSMPTETSRFTLPFGGGSRRSRG